MKLTVLIFLIFFMGITAQDFPTGKVLWRFDFSQAGVAKKFPKEWSIETKFMTKAANFTIKNDADGTTFLRMEANKATASAVCKPTGFNPADAPIVRWCWRMVKLPLGADSRIATKDDQAIGIYIGSGGALSKQSVSYRWDTETPIASDGNCVYGAGTIKVKWFTLRNKHDKLGEWIIEERNWLEDYRKAWGKIPKDIYFSISCNSQYTGSDAVAEIKWVEFISK